jgi:hypothetical protein
MGLAFRPAQRSNTIPLIGLYGQSGSGKTMSALLLGRGFVGEQGRLGMIDTESGRGELYADVIPGGYQVMPLGEPFSPDRYIEAIDAAINAELDALVIDSGSHEWEGLGGVLDQAAENERKTGKPGLHCWKEPKLRHQRFMLKLLSAPIPVIICLRAKHKSRQIKNPRTGKQEIVKDDHTTPMQADDFIFELTAHAEVLPDHTINLTKCSHPNLRECFPQQQPISVETGRAIAAWAKGAGGGAPAATQPAQGSAGTQQAGQPSAPASGAENAPQRITQDRYDELVSAGWNTAYQGMEAVKEWWSQLSRAEQAELKDVKEDWKAKAAEVDQNAQAGAEA